MLELDGIFLDLYGTLTAGDRAAVERVCEDVVRDTGVPVTAQELSILWGERFFHALDFCSGDGFCTLFDIETKTLVDTLREFGKTVDPVPYARQLQQYWMNPPLHPEAREFLERMPVPVCIVSNADHADAEMVVRRHELRVHAVVTSERARSYKPDRAIFELALRETGWRRDRVIHVGDSLHSDVGGAIVMGFKSGWVNRQHRIHDIGTHTADYEFADLLGLLKFLG